MSAVWSVIFSLAQVGSSCIRPIKHRGTGQKIESMMAVSFLSLGGR